MLVLVKDLNDPLTNARSSVCQLLWVQELDLVSNQINVFMWNTMLLHTLGKVSQIFHKNLWIAQHYLCSSPYLILTHL